MRMKYARKFLFRIQLCGILRTTIGGRTDRAYVSRYDQSSWNAN